MSATADYQGILAAVHAEVVAEGWSGKVANYIPALAGVSPQRFGLALRTVEGEVFTTGDANERFSLQSISKLFALTLALGFEGEGLFERVGREPSGTAFNSLVQLEVEGGIPRNPFINAGALVVVDVLLSHLDDARRDFLGFVRSLDHESCVEYDLAVARSEREWGDRNAALAHFLKSFGNLHNPVADVLDAYVAQCSLAMSCVELTAACQFLAQGGRNPVDGRRLLTPSLTKRTNALLLTCGVYDAAGDFAYRVGLPGKSGVGGGIVAVMPGQWVAAAWSPALSASGNSCAGMRALELLTTKSGVSIF
jgi:glutaminase